MDGDGQVQGVDLRRIFDAGTTADLDVVEGVRISRDDPLYRTVASEATRALVRLRCGRAPADANTPVRCYRAAILEQLLAGLPAGVLTPNLFLSAAARSGAIRLREEPIGWYQRRGDDPTGVTWQSRSRIVPGHRFLGFCLKATAQWVAHRS